MPTLFSGGCVCGSIRYELTGEPMVMFNCHCRDCQRASGGPYTAVIYVRAKRFKTTKGAPCFYNTPSGPWVITSALFAGIAVHDCSVESPIKGYGITASSLDDPSLFRPQFDIFTSNAQPWDHMDPKLPKFEKYPPM